MKDMNMKKNSYAVLCLAFVLVMSVSLLLMSGFGNTAEKIGQVIMAAAAAAGIGLGCYFPRCGKDSVPAICLPWTMSDEENREATHRFAGIVWVVCGVLSLLGISSGNFNAVVVFVVIALLLPVLYSYRMERKKKKH
ncbi:MAG: SdpI family protein [Lachnospiraceae bacterium]|nr:SdpI family protein [Lachnospiraceae bacterium]